MRSVYPEDKQTAGSWSFPPMTMVLPSIVMILHLLFPLRACGQSSAGPANVGGAVIVVDSGETSYLPGAKVELKGSTTMETETDADGKYSFSGVDSGTYTLEASFPGMHAEEVITVTPGASLTEALELKLAAVTTSVTVSGSPTSEAEISTTTATISEKTIDAAPNVDERFESLLPLVPGVVRGPDGHINMKGTRATQSGALVDSANVTDPASGGPAINLPLDVVSSVKVISNPYDPQYGKLTGAVSTVETKTSSFEKYHFSIQNVVPRLRDRAGTIAGLGAATPRATLTGPLLSDRLAFTQSMEYRFVRTPVNSLPPLQRDTKLEGFDSFT
jgi:hypothetical protein